MDKKLLCPRCHVELTTDEIGSADKKIEIEYCPNCQGLWFDKGELQKIDEDVDPVFLEFRKVPKIETQLESLLCPKCGGTKFMNKVEHDRDSHVIIDSCSQCGGTWLDSGELDAIMRENIASVMTGYFKNYFKRKKNR
jgi:Zn-finger nucleic acid-binding protein